MRDRRPSVSGSFYEGSRRALVEQIEWCFLHRVGPGRLPERGPKPGRRSVIGAVAPHAGYIYSGPVAAHTYYEISKEPPPEVVVLIGPNHTGYGAGVSVWGGGKWETPLGKAEVDSAVVASISKSGAVEVDEDAHIHEHSLEVQLPFLQYLFGDRLKIVPICMMLQDFETASELGSAVAASLSGRSSVVIASTDFSHYVDYRSAYTRDSEVCAAIERMDARSVGETVRRRGISMCGPGPVMATIIASAQLGARSAKKLCYATSGDTSGPKAEVVGYGSFAFFV